MAGQGYGAIADTLRGAAQHRCRGPTKLCHSLVGGDMLPSTSPNDPIFYMDHCNVVRIWEAWMQKPGGPGRIYVPATVPMHR